MRVVNFTIMTDFEVIECSLEFRKEASLKSYLFAPGPTPVPEKALLKMAEPIMHHREKVFEDIFTEVREGLKYLFETKQEVLILTSSGTGAMEGAVCNLFSPGDRVLVVRAGKFGQRWGELAEAFGLAPVFADFPWGEAADPGRIAEMLQNDSSIRGVLIQASETSTGVMHPIKEIAEITSRREDVVLVVDGITAVGVFELPMDEWGIDVVVTGSQKALMLPPGLSFVALSDKAWKMTETSRLPKYYFDLKKHLTSARKSQTPYTPAISLIVGLNEILTMLKEESLEGVFARHRKLAKATRAAVSAMGLSLLAKTSPSDALTAAVVPEEIDGIVLKKAFLERYGITIAGGQDQLKGKIIRIAHLGYFDPVDMFQVIAGLEMALYKMGYEFALGSGMKALEQELA
jgi:aspartate aminotransferase-like enzyme